MRPTQHRPDITLIGTGTESAGRRAAVAGSRRPRGERRGLEPDPGVEIFFDPRLHLSEHLLQRITDLPERAGEDRATLLRQVRNLLQDARSDQSVPGPAASWVPAPRPGRELGRAMPALLELDELLLSMAWDGTTARAERIMRARRLLHWVDEETADAHWPGQRRRRLHDIINALAGRPDPESASGEAKPTNGD